MSPVTHFLASWALAEKAGATSKQRFWITFAGVAPDMDGLGIVLDAANQAFGRGPSDWFSAGHHVFLHGAAGCIAILVLAVLCGCRDLKTALWMVAAFHLHLFCDLLGSRGPGTADFWPIVYLAPFSMARPLVWQGQWALNGWQNFAITILLIFWSGYRAVKNGISPVSIFSKRFDHLVVTTLRNRFGHTATTEACKN